MAREIETQAEPARQTPSTHRQIHAQFAISAHQQERIVEAKQQTHRTATHTQTRLVRMENGLVLSTTNPIHLSILEAIYPERYAITSNQYEYLRPYTRTLSYSINEPNQFRNNLRRVYTAAAAAGAPPPPNNPNNNDDDWANVFSGNNGNGGNNLPPCRPRGNNNDGNNPPNNLPQIIAEQIALIYYTELNLTLDDVKRVLKEFFPTKKDLEKLTNAFVDKITNARIDKGRYTLLTLLPDKDFIKTAAAQLRGNKPCLSEKEKIDAVEKACSTYYNYITKVIADERKLNNHNEKACEKNDTFVLAKKKQASIKELLDISKNKMGNRDKLEELSKAFNKHRGAIDERRDLPSATLLKVLATILSLGTLAIVGAILNVGVWKVKGRDETARMAALLPEPIAPAA